MKLKRVNNKGINDFINEGYNDLYVINSCNLKPGNLFIYKDEDSLIDDLVILSTTNNQCIVYSRFDLDRDIIEVLTKLFTIKIYNVYTTSDYEIGFIVESSGLSWENCMTDEEKYKFTMEQLRLHNRLSAFSLRTEDKLYEFAISKITRNYSPRSSYYHELNVDMLSYIVVYTTSDDLAKNSVSTARVDAFITKSGLGFMEIDKCDELSSLDVVLLSLVMDNIDKI